MPASLPTRPQALRVNGLEQLCNNLASERLQLFSSQVLRAQEQVGAWAWARRGHASCFPEQRPCTDSSNPEPPRYGCLSPSEPPFSHL